MSGVCRGLKRSLSEWRSLLTFMSSTLRVSLSGMPLGLSAAMTKKRDELGKRQPLAGDCDERIFAVIYVIDTGILQTK